eukprot:4552089-Amphidinium_carterae.1
MSELEKPAFGRSRGLRNLGNTCFMASALQCLANVAPLREYFLTSKYKESLDGKVADGFAELLKELWTAPGEATSVAPWSFKDIVDAATERFRGSQQQDAMEFIEFLLDALKEDCNRVKGKKLYTERPDAGGRRDDEVALEASKLYLLQNDSDIDDFL